MCGRFVQFRSLEKLSGYLPIDVPRAEAVPNYNIAPTQQVLAVARYNDQNHLVNFYWGLVPSWAKDISIRNKMINARSETVATKPSFRNAFKKRRCLIPADGFYEWKGAKGQKQPVYITMPDNSPFVFAGLWETWNNKGKSDEVYRSCTIITTNASVSMQEIHHRMPVILKPEVYGAWLDPKNQDVTILQNLIQNQIQTELINIPVSKQVNSVKNNSPDNIRPLDSKEKG